MAVSNLVTPTRFPIFQEYVDRIIVPRHYGEQRFGPPASVRLYDEDGSTALGRLTAFQGALRPEQRIAAEAFEPSRRCGILFLPCGLIIVHKDFLLSQWRERIAQFLPRARVGLIKGPVVDVHEKDIVIGSLQSLSMKSYDASIFEGISLLVVDECHRVGTEVFSRALMHHCFRYTLGLSATVERNDGITPVFMYFLGPVVYRGQPRCDEVCVIQYEHSSDDPSYCKEETIKSINNPNMSRMVNNVTSFAPRNDFIVRSIKSVLCAEPQRKVLVLSDRKQQLAMLKQGLEDVGVTAGYYYGGLKAVQLAEYESKQVLLATYAYAAEGIATVFLPRSDEAPQRAGDARVAQCFGMHEDVLEVNGPHEQKVGDGLVDTRQVCGSQACYAVVGPQLVGADVHTVVCSRGVRTIRRAPSGPRAPLRSRRPT